MSTAPSSDNHRLSSGHSSDKDLLTLDNERNAHVSILKSPTSPMYMKSPTTPRRFRDSVHTIQPSNPNPPKRYEPLLLRLVIVIGTPLVMFLLGIGLEIASALSTQKQGFYIEALNIRTVFGDISAQFIASFFPTLLIIPNAILWRELDWMLRSYQPYVSLKKGGAKAEESILLDYVELGPLLAIPRALKYKHRIIFLSSLTAVFTYLFQPLTGAVLQIRQTPQERGWTATRTETIGLSPGIDSMQGFLAAAGYVDAHVLHDFPDLPENVNDRGWATGKFTFPAEPGLNATLALVTNGIRSNANCSNPIDTPTVSGTTEITISSTSIDNCNATAAFNSTSESVRQGVVAAPCPNSDLDVPFQPVMFWFYREIQGRREAKTVFCAPWIAGAEVEVVSNAATQRINTVTERSKDVPFNDVLNGDHGGKAFNGVVFDPSNDTSVSARAAAVTFIVPSAMWQNMTTDPRGVDTVWALPNGVLDATSNTYTIFLALLAKSIYFVPGDSALPGKLVAIEPRLWVDPFPAHFLASLLILTGIVGIYLHAVNRRQTKNIHLAVLPGTIAGTVALTSRSGWGELLTPYDDIIVLEQKLDDLRFTLDKRTGAIIADDYRPEPMGRAGTPDAMSNDQDVRMSLMTKVESPAPESSSFAAFSTAAGMRPWKDSGSKTSKK
ncbi:hypothetical protein BKA70DRAFT_1294535 [Coprinopsis sp. MPI-PUGE-AT-0042]|nr:hypothetical protein BKA70DRAFT_1294535 [Coprinopsis sp. MPI-PUGE-AT-0042]